jgi:hypothetical protein
MEEGDVIRIIAHWVGLVCAVLGFFGSWAYCTSEYGYLLGFGLGWLPSAILAAIIYAVIRYMWWLLILLGIGVAVLVTR